MSCSPNDVIVRVQLPGVLLPCGCLGQVMSEQELSTRVDMLLYALSLEVPA